MTLLRITLLALVMSLNCLGAFAWQVVRNPDGTFKMEETYFDCGEKEPCKDGMVHEIDYPEGSKDHWAQASFCMRGYWENLISEVIRYHQKIGYEDRKIMTNLNYPDLIKKAEDNDLFRPEWWFKKMAKRKMYGCIEKGMNAEMGSREDPFDFNQCWDKNSKSVYANGQYSGPNAFVCTDKNDCNKKMRRQKDKVYLLGRKINYNFFYGFYYKIRNWIYCDFGAGLKWWPWSSSDGQIKITAIGVK